VRVLLHFNRIFLRLCIVAQTRMPIQSSPQCYVCGRSYPPAPHDGLSNHPTSRQAGFRSIQASVRFVVAYQVALLKPPVARTGLRGLRDPPCKPGFTTYSDSLSMALWPSCLLW
jgi:hypothetical protein